MHWCACIQDEPHQNMTMHLASGRQGGIGNTLLFTPSPDHAGGGRLRIAFAGRGSDGLATHTQLIRRACAYEPCHAKLSHRFERAEALGGGNRRLRPQALAHAPGPLGLHYGVSGGRCHSREYSSCASAGRQGSEAPSMLRRPMGGANRLSSRGTPTDPHTCMAPPFGVRCRVPWQVSLLALGRWTTKGGC